MVEPIQLRKKVCLLGDAAVGKSSLIKRYVFNQFDEKYITTIGTNVSKKDIKLALQNPNAAIQNYDITLAIWDIIGQKELHSFNLNYFRNANGGIVVCDITRRDTLDSILMWTSSFFNTIGQVPLVFVINKYDLLDRADFQIEEVARLAAQFNAPYFVSSALTGENVERAFYALCEQMIKYGKVQTGPQNKESKVTAEIVVEFSNNIGGIERGIPLIKEVFKIAGVDFLNPTKEQLLKALPDLIQLLRDLQGNEVADGAAQRFNLIIAKL